MAKISKDDLTIGVNFTPCSKCDRVEVMRGRWENGFCSVCGEEALTEWNECGGEHAYTRYCPFCGAFMAEERKSNG